MISYILQTYQMHSLSLQRRRSSLLTRHLNLYFDRQFSPPFPSSQKKATQSMIHSASQFPEFPGLISLASAMVSKCLKKAALMVGDCHKLSWINEVRTLNLGLRKIKPETTTPQIISFHRTPQREKHKHRTPNWVSDHRNTASRDFTHRITVLTTNTNTSFSQCMACGAAAYRRLFFCFFFLFLPRKLHCTLHWFFGLPHFLMHE